MMDIFNESYILQIPEVRIEYFTYFLSPYEGMRLFEYLFPNTYWEEEYLKVKGKKVLAPREVAYFGDKNYKYAGVFHLAKEFDPQIEKLRQKVELYTKQKFNSALLNYYKQGTNSIGWHSDDEHSLGKSPIIASVSIGGSRKFQLKHKETKKIYPVWLDHGSLLLMGAGTQEKYSHQLPKTKEADPRINITFRYIYE